MHSIHTTLTDIFRMIETPREDPTLLNIPGQEWMGWLNPKRYQEAKDDIASVTKRLDLAAFSDVFVVGIGGSFLGCKALAAADDMQAVRSKLHFLGTNVHTADFLEGKDLFFKARHPLVVIISKSGSTIETAVASRFMLAWLRERDMSISSHVVVVTDPKQSLLKTFAEEAGCATLSVPPDIGGRYSVFTAVGAFPLVAAGLDLTTFYAGVEEAFQQIPARKEELTGYVDFRLAQIHRHKTIELLMHTGQRQEVFVKWIQQLFAESEGKKGHGLYPVGFAISTDLHSTGQFVQEGKPIFCETYLKFSPSETLKIPESNPVQDPYQKLGSASLAELENLIAQACLEAHQENDTKHHTLELGSFDLQGLTQAMAFMMVACATFCQLQGLNAFNQPGVEVYKKILKNKFLT